jgi:hypothetical protein
MKSILCVLAMIAAASCEPYTEADFRAECEAVFDSIDDYECGYYVRDEIEELSYYCGVYAQHYADEQAMYESVCGLNDCMREYWERHRSCGWDDCYWGNGL